MRTLKLIAICVVVVFMASCSNDQAKRQEVREKLDAEFEEQTGEIMERAEELRININALLDKHDKMDGLHTRLDERLDPDNPDPVLVALQQKHLKWEEDHKQVLVETRDLIEEFERRHALHEAMEKSHGNVPIEQIEEEHEEFEVRLKAFKEQFESALGAIEKANHQMEIIFEEHGELDEMY